MRQGRPAEGNEQDQRPQCHLQRKGAAYDPRPDRPPVRGEQHRDAEEQEQARAGMEQLVGHGSPVCSTCASKPDAGRSRNTRGALPVMVKLRRVSVLHASYGITAMSLIGRLVSKILGNEDRPVVRDERNSDSSNAIGRLVTKILRR